MLMVPYVFLCQKPCLFVATPPGTKSDTNSYMFPIEEERVTFMFTTEIHNTSSITVIMPGRENNIFSLRTPSAPKHFLYQNRRLPSTRVCSSPISPPDQHHGRWCRNATR